jgi:hypothetical protein
MFVRHNSLGASLLTRESACASSAPGSFLWNSYNCGASAPAPAPTPTQSYTPAPAPAPAPTQSYTPAPTQAPTPTQSYTPAPAAQQIAIDAALNQRLREEYDARVKAEILASEAARKSANSDDAAKRASLEAGMYGPESGSASYANFAPGVAMIDEDSYPASGGGGSGGSVLWALLAAGGLAALLMAGKR